MPDTNPTPDPIDRFMPDTRFHKIMRWDKFARIYRLCALHRSHYCKGGEWLYDEKFTLALCRPWRLAVRREYWGLIVCVLGLRFHYQRTYGGRYA